MSRKDIFGAATYKQHAYGINHCDDKWYSGSSSGGYYKHNNGVSHGNFKFKEGEVDMMLDIDKGELKFCVVGKKDKGEPMLYNLPKQENGWIPHLLASSIATELRIAKISSDLYGEPIEIFT